MRGFLAAAAILALTGSPAPGQSPARPSPAEVAAIEACLADAAQAGARRACLGRVAEPCRAAGGGAACWRRERAIWDGVLDRAFTAALRATDDADRARLNDVQRAWLAYLDATCAYPPLLRRLDPDACAATATALRAVEVMEGL